jgi:hypothetical protein
MPNTIENGGAVAVTKETTPSSVRGGATVDLTVTPAGSVIITSYPPMIVPGGIEPVTVEDRVSVAVVGGTSAGVVELPPPHAGSNTAARLSMPSIVLRFIIFAPPVITDRVIFIARCSAYDAAARWHAMNNISPLSEERIHCFR